MAAGTCRLSLVTTDAAGNRSKPLRLRMAIVR
jgi:hypothetical protein